MPADSARKARERADLVCRILKNGFEMNACSNCARRNRTCFSSPGDSNKCAECVRRKLKCDQHGPNHEDWVKLEREEERLEREEEETLAKLLRLRKQKKFLRTRGKEMLRRGLKTLDELDEMEEKEKKEKEEAELHEQQAQATTASNSAPDDLSGDPAGFSGVAFGVEVPLSPSFWESLDSAGETAAVGPHS